AEGFLSDNRVMDEIIPGRGARKTSTRLWPHTEWAKASAVEWENGDRSAATSAMLALVVLQRDFCRDDLEGTWVEHLDVAGMPITDFTPATSLYHILLGVAEVGRVFGLL